MYLHTSIVFFLFMGLINTINDFKTFDESKANNEAVKDSIIKNLKDDGIEVGELDFIEKYNQKLDSVIKQNEYKSLFNSDSIPQSEKDSIYQQLIKLSLSVKLIDVDVNTDEIGRIDLNNIVGINMQELAVKKQLKLYFLENKIEYKQSKSVSSDNSFNNDSDLFKNKFGVFYRFSKNNDKISANEALDSLGYEKTRTNLFKYQKARDFNKLLKDKDFQKTYLSSIISNLSIAIFFLLPIFTLFFSLFYIRHRYNYTEHLVVVFNLQTVFFIMLILIIISQLVSNNFSEFVTPILQLLLLFYIYKTLRNFYKQSRLKTIVKLSLLNFSYIFLAIIGLSIVSFLSFIM